MAHFPVSQPYFSQLCLSQFSAGLQFHLFCGDTYCADNGSSNFLMEQATIMYSLGRAACVLVYQRLFRQTLGQLTRSTRLSDPSERGWCMNSNRLLPHSNTETQNESSLPSVQLNSKEMGDVPGQTFTTNGKLVSPAVKEISEVENQPPEGESKDITQLSLSHVHPDAGDTGVQLTTSRESVGEESMTEEIINQVMKRNVENQPKSVQETSDLNQEMQPLQTNNSSQFTSQHLDVAKYVSEDNKPTSQTFTDKEEKEGLHSAEDTKYQNKNIQDNKMQQDRPVEAEKDMRTEQAKSSDSPQSEPGVMPSFDEWKKKMLAEQEIDGIVSSQDFVPGKKLAAHKREKNYASYKCGAKIMGSNPEAEGKSRILSEMMDEYMLNPCKAKIWFVVELCESIQANQIELANFELFSSMPREFSVYWSDRYPVRDWMLIGNYEADNRRELQSFPLKQTGYGKFIKVEFDSHYGSEHYCPLSTVRVFGTSMVEEYEIMETADEPSHPLSLENEDDRLDISDESHVRTNLFGSAKEAILNIVKKVVLVLSGKEKEIQEEKDVGTEPPTKVQSSDTETKSVTNYSVSSNTTANVTEYYGKNIALPHGISKLIPYLFTYDLCNIHNKLHSDTSSLACWFLHVVLGPKSPDQLCFMNSVPQPMVDKAVKCEKGTTLQLGYNVEELHYSIANLPTSGPTELPVVTSESVTLTLITQNTSGSLPYDQSSILSHSLRDENLANIQEKFNQHKLSQKAVRYLSRLTVKN
ncbi:uncharacterized protein LOC143245986 [Tachypleus tridentatus]|uniref:uncharacterized protein LOC143245986 n=1 Tax=Tachypleus tridentatus TaxID=6853 RepID=UPI003FD640DC